MTHPNDLESLRESITKMSEDDLHKLIANTRDARKRQKAVWKPWTKRGSENISKKKTSKLENLLDSFSPEEKAAFLADMEEKE